VDRLRKSMLIFVVDRIRLSENRLKLLLLLLLLFTIRTAESSGLIAWTKRLGTFSLSRFSFRRWLGFRGTLGFCRWLGRRIGKALLLRIGRFRSFVGVAPSRRLGTFSLSRIISKSTHGEYHK
jgi:hypothetical protein